MVEYFGVAGFASLPRLKKFCRRPWQGEHFYSAHLTVSSAVIIRAGARVGAIIGMIDAIGAVLAAGAMTVIGRVAVARPAAAARLAIIACQKATQASDNIFQNQ